MQRLYFVCVLLTKGVSLVMPAGPLRPAGPYYCDGERQSPINIRTDSVIYGRPFSIKFILHDVMLKGRCTNNGNYYTCQCDSGYKLTGVPYHERDVYQLDSWHFHFGRSDYEGSEHTLDGKRYAGETAFILNSWHFKFYVGQSDYEGSVHTVAWKRYAGEIHMVYYNTKYGSYNASLNYPDGRTVVAVFIKNGPISNRPDIDASLREVLPLERRLDSQPIEIVMAVIDLLPDSSDIYTYSGSATTSPCRQNVQWIVHRQPIILSERTLRLARQMIGSSGVPMGRTGNYRATQRMNGRYVEANFIPLSWKSKPSPWFSHKY